MVDSASACVTFMTGHFALQTMKGGEPSLRPRVVCAKCQPHGGCLWKGSKVKSATVASSALPRSSCCSTSLRFLNAVAVPERADA